MGPTVRGLTAPKTQRTRRAVDVHRAAQQRTSWAQGFCPKHDAIHALHAHAVCTANVDHRAMRLHGRLQTARRSGGDFPHNEPARLTAKRMRKGPPSWRRFPSPQRHGQAEGRRARDRTEIAAVKRRRMMGAEYEHFVINQNPAPRPRRQRATLAVL